MKTDAAVIEEQEGEFKFKKIELKEPSKDELLVRIVASGVCHTDSVVRDLGMSPYPIVLGHEGAGIVEKVGENVSQFKKGDHVVLSYAMCGECDQCLKGYPASCVRLNELCFGGKMIDGTHRIELDGKEVSTFFGQSSFAKYSVVNYLHAVKVDPEVDLKLLGPLGCGIQTGAGTVLNRLRPETGSTIIITGAGAVGLSAVMAAKIAGCLNIIAVDIHENRLSLAKELGATHTVNSKETDLVEFVQKLTGGVGAEYALDTTGVPPVVKQALNATGTRGTLAVVGATGDVTFNIQQEVMGMGRSVIGVVEGDAIPKIFIPQLVEYYKQGRFPFDKLTKYFEFKDIDKAFQAS